MSGHPLETIWHAVEGYEPPDSVIESLALLLVETTTHSSSATDAAGGKDVPKLRREEKPTAVVARSKRDTGHRHAPGKNKG